MISLPVDDIDRLNSIFRSLKEFHESFNITGFFIQPHVMHVNTIDRGTFASADGKTHSHRAFEFSMILSGKVQYETGGAPILIEAGQSIVIPPDTPHSWLTVEDSVIFSFMLFISCHGEGARENMTRLKQAIEYCRYCIKSCDGIIQPVMDIINEADNTKSGFDEKIQCLTRIVYIELFRRLLPDHRPERQTWRQPPRRGDITASVVEQVYFYVQDNLAQPVKLQDISSFLGISVNHLNAVFKKHHGCSIHKYIISRRIEKACSLLQKTDRPLKDIAAAVGYEDTNYFCRIFKKHNGVTPSQFRE